MLTMFKKFPMVRTGLLLVLITAGINLCFGQMYWTNWYDGANPVAMQPVGDGNYFVAGTRYSNPPGSSVGWIAKLNPEGDTLWTKTIGVLEFNGFSEIKPADKGGFFLVGSSSSIGVGVDKGLVVKINNDGDVIWKRTYGKPGELYEFNSIHQCTDGNFLIAGSAYTNELNYCGSLVKITPDGDTLWTRISSGSLQSILVSSDQNYLVTGSLQNSVSGEYEILLLKISNAGKIVWTRTFASSRSQMGGKIHPAGDGNYLLLGHSLWLDSIGPGETVGRYDGLLMKITPEGDSIWTRIYSTSATESKFTDILSSKDGYFVIAGYKYSSTDYKPDYKAWLLKINQTGDTVWTRSISGPQDLHAFSKILPADNEKYLVLGSIGDKWTISCMVDDQYANKDSLFSFKIPPRGVDSLNFGYKPLKVPSGMMVTAGGTVSWTPATDSVYRENAKFVVVDDQGRKDTLSLNFFVNMKNQSYQTRAMYQVSQDKVPDVISVSPYPQRGKVQFNFPASAAFLSIYDMSGRLIDQIASVTATVRQTVVWPAGGARFHSGQYIARAVVGNKTEAKVFLLTR